MNQSKFKTGNFVQFKNTKKQTSFGIAYVYNDMLSVIHYDNGLPQYISEYDFSNIKVANKKNAIQHFALILSGLESKIQKGGLEAAKAGHHLYHLKPILNELEHSDFNPMNEKKRKIEEPSTGIFVIEGVYAGLELTMNMQGLKVDKSLFEYLKVDEISAAKFLKSKKLMNGFGKILPYHIENKTHYKLDSFAAYHIPEEYTNNVNDLIILSKKSDSVNNHLQLTETLHIW